MQNRLDQVLLSRISSGKEDSFRLIDSFVFLIATFAALYARIVLFGYESNDYLQFLLPWYQELKQAGGFAGLGLSLGDYTPPYLCFLACLTYLPVSPLLGIKLFSCVFDFVLAVFLLKIVLQKWHSAPLAVTAYAAALFFPTVLLNSAFWAQCDSIFTAFLVMSVYFFLRKNSWGGMICFAVAFTWKLQAIFLFPLLLLLWLLGRLRLHQFLAIPAIYLLSILPAWIAGRPLADLLTIYVSQTGTYSRLSLNAPNLFIVIGDLQSDPISWAGIFLTGMLILMTLYLLYRARLVLTRDKLLTAALYFALLLPFFLPHMHERYFYPADVLALAVAFVRPKRFFLPVLVGTASMAGYIPFLFGGEPIPLEFAALLMAAALGVTGYDLFQAAWLDQQRLSPEER